MTGESVVSERDLCMCVFVSGQASFTGGNSVWGKASSHVFLLLWDVTWFVQSTRQTTMNKFTGGLQIGGQCRVLKSSLTWKVIGNLLWKSVAQSVVCVKYTVVYGAYIRFWPTLQLYKSHNSYNTLHFRIQATPSTQSMLTWLCPPAGLRPDAVSNRGSSTRRLAGQSKREEWMRLPHIVLH